VKLPLLPSLGFINSRPRQDVPINALTGPSRDWLVGEERYKRRKGSVNFGSSLTAGILESKWGALARRMLSATLASMVDLFPTPLTLFVNEVTKSATLSFRSTNGADSWRTVGMDFSATTYPDTGVPTHRVVPMIYRNEYGGLTVHRLNTAEYRQHMAAGSRDVLQVGSEVCWGGYDSAPARWDGHFGDDAYTVFPLGLIQPLQMPICTAGTDLGAGTKGPFLGSNAWFFSACFENDRGELSGFTIPRPPGSAWAAYPGFGYVQVDSANPTHYFDSMRYTMIPQGPPGTRWIRLMRSTKVDIAASGAGAIVQPSIADLQFFARIPQGQTSYVDSDGNDLALDADPRIEDMYKGGLQMAPCARHMGRFDGHLTLGCLRPNPHAMWIAPWNSGASNLAIDDATLYGATSYFAAVTPNDLYLRSVTAGVSTDTIIPLTGLTLRELVDLINHDASITDTTYAASTFDITASLFWHVIDIGVLATAVPIGALVTNSAFPPNTRVIKNDLSAYPLANNTHLIAVDKAPSRASAGGGEDVVVSSSASGSDVPWASQAVFGVDADESTDSLLRTYVGGSCDFNTGDTVITVQEAASLSEGMLIVLDAFPAGTTVTDISGLSVTVSNAATRDSVTALEPADFGYDTGDTDLATQPGFIRMFGNCWPAPLFWNLEYLDRYPAKQLDSIFSAASPGYAQDGVNTWMQRNRRGAPDTLGRFMGMADVGPYELQFYARGRMLLANPRTGLTHSDTDYTKQARAWNRGLRSPYALCAGAGWVIFLSDEGFFACDAASGEHPLSENIYKAGRTTGERGELEHAISRCIVASESDTDDYAIHAQVHGSVLHVRYCSNSDSTYPDREIRYDFSRGVNKSGLAELLQDDGSPYPWSAPLTLRASVSAIVTDSTGPRHLAAIDSNAGTADGRIDEIDTGTLDEAAYVVPVGYTGLYIPEDLSEIQPTMAYVVSTKAGAGMDIALTPEPEKAPEDAQWDALDVPTSGADAFGRSVIMLKPNASLRRAAIGARIWDDGTGPCPELSKVLITAEVVKSTTSSARR